MSNYLFSGSGNSALFILIVNVVVSIIGIAMAFAAGRAIASTWRPYSSVPVYALILTAAERFLHFALAGQQLLSVQFFLMSFVLLLLVASLGYRRMRAQQMVRQYSWLYSTTGSLTWKTKT